MSRSLSWPARPFWIFVAQAVAPAPDLPPPAQIDADLDLLRAGCSGDEAAFRRLVENHQRRLLTVCERLLGSAAEAQEIVQETFLQAFRKGGSFRPSGRVGAWLYRIAVNLCLRRLRRRRLVRFIGLGGAGLSSADKAAPGPSLPADPSPGPEQQAAARRRWATTRRWIDALPTGQRAALILVRFEGLSVRAAADVLDLSEKAVEGRLARAIAALKSKQEQAGGPHA